MSSSGSGIAMYLPCDEDRLFPLSLEKFNRLSPEPYRSPFYRDFARLIHSPSFRRLQGKSQLFPGNESDFFRNRLTHSIEVAQIAKSIANRLNWILSGSPQSRHDIVHYIDTDLIQFAGLAHDMGHPPFGHQGEFELNEIMKHHGGFEGNAQTLRLLCKIEKKIKDETTAQASDDYGFNEEGLDKRFGLNLTVRSLGAILKYDNAIPVIPKPKESSLNTVSEFHKGYYFTETVVVNKIKELLSRGKEIEKFETLEMQIMDIADDIAYSVYDLEDSLKGGFISGLDLITDHNQIYENVSVTVKQKLKKEVTPDDVKSIISKIFNEFAKKVSLKKMLVEDAFELIKQFENGEVQQVVSSYAYATSRDQAKNGYKRSHFTSLLIGKFIRSVNIQLNSDNPAFSRVYIDNECKVNDHTEKDIDVTIEVLKRFTYQFQIQSHKLKIVEARGRDIVRTIFEKLLASKGDFLPNDYHHIYNKALLIKDENERELQRYRIICDFVASMTDKYAVEFYGRLKSENPQTIFKLL
jgi:dGTPase